MRYAKFATAATASTITRSRRLPGDRNIKLIMEQPRYSFKWRWALSSIAVGVIATTAYALGADQLPSGQMLFGGGLVGLSIYAISEVLNGLFGRHIAELRPALRAPAR